MLLPMTRVLIVDDHPGFRARARRALEAAGWEVVGEAADGAGALAYAGSPEPDVVLLDVQLPDISGLDVATRLTARGGRFRIVLTSTRDREDIEPLVGATGASGFVPKAELSAAAIQRLL